jgi:hypothetical protein
MRIFRLLDVENEMPPIIRGKYGELKVSFMPGEVKVFLVLP